MNNNSLNTISYPLTSLYHRPRQESPDIYFCSTPLLSSILLTSKIEPKAIAKGLISYAHKHNALNEQGTSICCGKNGDWKLFLLFREFNCDAIDLDHAVEYILHSHLHPTETSDFVKEISDEEYASILGVSEGQEYFENLTEQPVDASLPVEQSFSQNFDNNFLHSKPLAALPEYPPLSLPMDVSLPINDTELPGQDFPLADAAPPPEASTSDVPSLPSSTTKLPPRSPSRIFTESTTVSSPLSLTDTSPTHPLQQSLSTFSSPSISLKEYVKSLQEYPEKSTERLYIRSTLSWLKQSLETIFPPQKTYLRKFLENSTETPLHTAEADGTQKELGVIEAYEFVQQEHSNLSELRCKIYFNQTHQYLRVEDLPKYLLKETFGHTAEWLMSQFKNLISLRFPCNE